MHKTFVLLLLLLLTVILNSEDVENNITFWMKNAFNKNNLKWKKK